jgi:hypothetical protein
LTKFSSRRNPRFGCCILELEKFLDEVSMFTHESDDDCMERWRREYLPKMDTINSDTEEDTPPDPIKELKEIILNMHYAHTKQLEAMNEQFVALEDQLEARLTEYEAYIEYPDPIECELDSEKDKEVHEEIPDESMDEAVIYFEGVKELEFENIEYLDDSSPHPPPEEPIFLKDHFENLEENSMMVPVVCSFPTSQPEDELMQDYVEMEGKLVYRCHTIMIIGWPPTLTVMNNKVCRVYTACHIPVFG